MLCQQHARARGGVVTQQGLVATAINSRRLHRASVTSPPSDLEGLPSWNTRSHSKGQESGATVPDL